MLVSISPDENYLDVSKCPQRRDEGRAACPAAGERAKIPTLHTRTSFRNNILMPVNNVEGESNSSSRVEVIESFQGLSPFQPLPVSPLPCLSPEPSLPLLPIPSHPVHRLYLSSLICHVLFDGRIPGCVSLDRWLIWSLAGYLISRGTEGYGGKTNQGKNHTARKRGSA